MSRSDVYAAAGSSCPEKEAGVLPLLSSFWQTSQGPEGTEPASFGYMDVDHT